MKSNSGSAEFRSAFDYILKLDLLSSTKDCADPERKLQGTAIVVKQAESMTFKNIDVAKENPIQEHNTDRNKSLSCKCRSNNDAIIPQLVMLCANIQRSISLMIQHETVSLYYEYRETFNAFIIPVIEAWVEVFNSTNTDVIVSESHSMEEFIGMRSSVESLFERLKLGFKISLEYHQLRYSVFEDIKASDITSLEYKMLKPVEYAIENTIPILLGEFTQLAKDRFSNEVQELQNIYTNYSDLMRSKRKQHEEDIQTILAESIIGLHVTEDIQSRSKGKSINNSPHQALPSSIPKIIPFRGLKYRSTAVNTVQRQTTKVANYGTYNRAFGVNITNITRNNPSANVKATKPIHDKENMNQASRIKPPTPIVHRKISDDAKHTKNPPIRSKIVINSQVRTPTQISPPSRYKIGTRSKSDSYPSSLLLSSPDGSEIETPLTRKGYLRSQIVHNRPPSMRLRIPRTRPNRIVEVGNF